MNRREQTYSFINQSKYLQWYYNTNSEGYPQHFHHGNFFEFIVPLYGSYKVIVEDITYHLDERDILIIPPGAVHRLLPSDKLGGRIVFMVDMDFMSLCENYSDIASIQTSVLCLRVSESSVYQKVYDLILQMRAEYYHKYPFRDTYIYSLILQIFVILSRDGQFEPIRESVKWFSKKRELFLQVQEYLRVHLQEDINLEMVAGFFGFSKYHFARIFKENTQITFKQYLVMLKMEQAARLLEHNTYLTVEEIGVRCGYKSYGTFVKAFKKQYGCTPREYKKVR